MRKTLSAGAIVTNEKGEVLLTTKKGDCWMFPKGHIEEGEELLLTALREVSEETGLPCSEIKVISQKPLGFFERFKGSQDGSNPDHEFKRIFLFHFKTSFTGKLQPIDNKHKAAKWFHKEDVCNVVTLKKDREFFESIQDRI